VFQYLPSPAAKEILDSVNSNYTAVAATFYPTLIEDNQQQSSNKTVTAAFLLGLHFDAEDMGNSFLRQ
jgi:hypothetical protein